MKKTIILITLIILMSTSISLTAQKPCSEHNRITHYKLYKECKDALKGIKKNKVEKSLSNINDKYKDLRKKYAPKTGAEMWKKYNENQ